MQNIVIVGAGPAGIGLGVLLQKAGIRHFSILEQADIGASFRQWPKEMRMITPSFPGQGFGALDLNAVVPDTSPAYTLGSEHPSGIAYADYLSLLANYFQLPVRTGTKVKRVDKVDGIFQLETSRGLVETRTLVWATGEYQFPNDRPFAGADMARHNRWIKSWQDIDAAHVTVIGGYESGVDAAFHLTHLGKKVLLISKSIILPHEKKADPSFSLSPFTQQRLHRARATGRLEIIEQTAVTSIRQSHTDIRFSLSDGSAFAAHTVPVLATGFFSGAKQISALFEWRSDGKPRLTAEDESTKVDNLFLIGPSVRQGYTVFCFIYKFRQRFAVVGQTIADRLELPYDDTVFKDYRDNQMYLDDLSCCKVKCEC
jgi:thioredoxin reductase